MCRGQRKDKQSSTKEKSKDKEMGHRREGVVQQGEERKEERNEKEDGKVYERKMQQRNVYRGKKGIQTVVQTKKGKTRRRRNGENKEDQDRTRSVEIYK